MVIKITNLMNWPDISTLSSGTLELYFTTSSNQALSSGTINYSTITQLTPYEIACTVTRTPNYTQGQPTNFSLNFTTPSILLDNSVIWLNIPLNQQRL
jgi:hypothetical protein